MRLSAHFIYTCLLAAAIFPAHGKVIVVNTTNNISPGPGETSLVQAIQSLADGDTIHFNIGGAGPFYLITPPLSPANGYPAITNNNVTIDGYSQPGAAPNTNTILAANNARIQIILDSREGGMHAESIPGFSNGESSLLLIKGATNVTLRGLCLLGPGPGAGDPGDPATYAVSYAVGSSGGNINGCWIGVAPDRTNVFRFQNAVSSFEGPTGTFSHDTVIGVGKNGASAAIARSQFNVIVGEYIPLLLEGHGQRIAGNFINVFPDGVTDYPANGSFGHDLQAFIEIGRSGDNLVIGTDGDGVNDAEERNIFGGATSADDGVLLEWYGASGHNMVIAGNYFGMAVDGTTRFTNSMKLFDQFNSSANVRIGTDNDGVSDNLEGNVISMNYPFAELFPAPTSTQPPQFARYEAGARISLRGNCMIGNTLAPFTYANGDGTRLNALTNSYAPFLDTAKLIPVLSTNSTQTHLRGSCAAGVAPYTNLVVDVYLADLEGWTNGQKFELTELAYTNPASITTQYHGFAQGRTWLASFTDNGPQDLNSAVGQFDFDISASNLGPDQLITLNVSYSAVASGIHNAEQHTSPFAYPVTLQLTPRVILTRTGPNVVLTWPTNTGLFTIQSTTTLTPATWTNITPPPMVTVSGTNFVATLPATNSTFFMRLAR